MKLRFVVCTALLCFVFSSCKKEKSFEKGSGDLVSCTPDYKGGCKLKTAVYNTFDPSNPEITYNFIYTGDRVSRITTDFDYNINLVYNGDKQISRIEYEDDATGEIFYYYELFYNSKKKTDSVVGHILDVTDFIYDSRYEFKYNAQGLLTDKTFWFYDETKDKLLKQNVYTYKYDNAQVTSYTDTLVTENPPLAIPYTIGASSVCNPFQLVHPQIEFFDFNGDDFNFGYTVLFTSQKIPASIGGQPVSVTYNSKNAPATISINGDLWATYTYDCP